MGMQYTCLDRAVMTANTPREGQIVNAEFDQILIMGEGYAGTFAQQDSDLALIQILIRLTASSKGETYLMNCNALDLVKLTNYMGGISRVSTDATRFQIYIPLGNVKLTGDTRMIVSIRPSAIANGGGAWLVSVYGIQVQNGNVPLRQYESFASGGDATFINCIELIATGAVASAQHNIIKLNLPNEQLSVDDSAAYALSAVVGQFEASYETMAVLWVDKSGRGQSVNVKSPASYNLLTINVLRW